MKKKTNVITRAQQNPLTIDEMKTSLFIPSIKELVLELSKKRFNKLPGGKNGKMLVAVKKPKKNIMKIKRPNISGKLVLD